MINGLCHSGNWGSLGSFGVWGWAGLILNMIFWVGLIGGITFLVVWARQRTRVAGATGPDTTGQPADKEILQAQYARGEITREQYEQKKLDVG